MTNQEKGAKLEVLLKDEAFTQKLAAVEGKNALQTLFEENGLEMSREEIDAFVECMNKAQDDELKEDDLEAVSGGAIGPEWIFEKAWKIMKTVGKHAWNLGKKYANWEDGR